MEKKLSAEEITDYLIKDIPSIPGTGCKCFEPNGSIEESSEIESHLCNIKELLSFSKIRKLGSMSQAIWHSNLQKAEVIHQVGSYWTTMGHSLDKKLYLFPEEALYLLEMGALEITYNDLILSLQRAYSLLLAPATNVPIENYKVYSQLNANGFIVLRHMTRNILTKYEKQMGNSQKPQAGTPNSVVNIKHEPENESEKKNLTDIFPLKIKDEDENTCLEKLRIFKSYQDMVQSNLHVHYDIYLLSQGRNSFKKTCTHLPNFRIVVHQGNDPMPDWKEFHHLVQQFEDEVPIIHAVVFPDFISFYNISPVNIPVCE